MALPPILQQLNQSQSPMAMIKQMMDSVRFAQNPQALLNQMAQNNPQLKNAMDIARQYGNDPQRAFYELARQKGVNPDDVLKMLK